MFQTIAPDNSSSLGVNSSSLGVSASPIADWFEGWMASYLGLTGIAADLLAAGIVLAIFLILSVAAKRFVADVAPRLVSRTRSSLDDELLKAVKGPIQALIIVVGIYLACKTLNGLPIGIVDVLDKLASIALILLCAYFIANLIGAFIKWYVTDIAPKTGSDLDDHLMPFLRKFLAACVYVVAGIMIIGLFVEITPLIAGLGVFGIAVALAAKEMLSNLFGAFAIITDRPFKAGDRLYMEGIGVGDVIDMGMRSTRVRTTDSRIVIVPNEKMAASRIVNLSQPNTSLRLEIKVGIGYGSDADKACAILEDIASRTPGVAKDPKPRAYVSELGDFAVAISLLVFIDTYKDDYAVPDRIYREALAIFKKEGIDIPYPTMMVRPRSA
jgi:MscS family membrane protein